MIILCTLWSAMFMAGQLTAQTGNLSPWYRWPHAGFTSSCSRGGSDTSRGSVWQPDNCMLKRHSWGGSYCIPSPGIQGGQGRGGLRLLWGLAFQGVRRAVKKQKSTNIFKCTEGKDYEISEREVKLSGGFPAIQGVWSRWHFSWALMDTEKQGRTVWAHCTVGKKPAV